MSDIIASVKSRLKNISVKMNRDYNFILQLYFQERFLYRISISDFKDNFILKGGLFIFISKRESFRPTRDIDFLGKNISNDSEEIKQVFKAISSIEVDDGVLFDIDSIKVETIKEGADYEGLRVKILSFLGNIKLNITIDIGYGDIVTPIAQLFTYPVLLENEAPKILAYNYETVIAEKIEAICKLGIATSRMKDFYDIVFLFENYSIDISILKSAIENTFNHRGTDLELFRVLANDELWKNQEIFWKEFKERINIKDKISFKDIKLRVIEYLNQCF